MRTLVLLFSGLFLILSFGGCGYTLRGNTRPFFEKNQIHNIYVEPVKNNSYKAGIEVTVYNALRKRIAQGGYVRIVDKEDQSDARISSTVTDASYTPAAISTGDTITYGDSVTPTRPELSNVQIAKSYNVNLKVRFTLFLEHPAKVLWGDEIVRSKSFPATVYLGGAGNTSALINESDYERSLAELALNVVTDAEESINTIY
jgi:hypothetical protein